MAARPKSNPVHDRERLAAVRATELLDSPTEESFDRLTRLAAKLTGAPVTFISLVDENRDFYKSCFGFPEPLASERQLTGTTFCHYALVSNGPLVIENTVEHPLYRDVPTVKSLGVQAYLGIPLVTSDGHAIGSFCAIDFKPRAWSPLNIEVMQELATSTLREIELRSAQTRLAAEQRLLDAVLKQMPAGVVVATPDGKIILSNARAREILGRDIGDLDGERATSRRPDGTPFTVDEWPLTRAARNGETVTDEEIVFDLPDGGTRVMHVSAAPVRDDGVIVAAVATVHDITEMRAAEEKARSASREKEEFFAAVTHELRTPMTSIIGWTRLLRMEALTSPDAVEAAEMIESSARIQARLVDDLLDVSRIAAGKIVLNREDVDVNAVIDEAARAAEPTAATTGVRLRTTLGSLPPVSADRGRLRQVLGNLLSNSIKFTPAGGLVEIESFDGDGEVRIVVRDTGRGIAPELLPHIFDRGRQARHAEQGGLGLGLAIVKNLVEMHGGTISAESEGAGCGATFTVTLPSVAR